MTKIKSKKIIALFITSILIFSSIKMDAFAYIQNFNISDDKQEISFQTSSSPEIIYPNEYSDKIRTQEFDENWKFIKENIVGAEDKSFNDSLWRELNLPHDYSIEQEFSKQMEAESGYLPAGVAWYRKSFTLPKTAKDKNIRLDFGGIYMNATIYLNGRKLGIHHYGYTPFSFDISEYVDFDNENILAIKVEHQIPSSRWYSGSGIYRSVKLTITDKLHIALNGIKIDMPDLKENTTNSTLSIKTVLENDFKEEKIVKVVNTIYEKDKEDEIASVSSQDIKLEKNKVEEIALETNIKNPKLWSIEDPNLYTVKTEIKVGEDIVDTEYTDFGFRYFEFDKQKGFSLNGKNIKLKGVCMHHDQGALGAVANKSAIKRQLEILKDMGCNSIRVTHNPAAKELLELSDELGMLIVDEAFDGWHKMKNGNINDYSRWFNQAIESDNKILGATKNMKWYEFDLAAMINSGYNHPSIIMWSLGNEIFEGTNGSEDGYEDIAQKLVETASKIDKTRLVTIGDNRLKNNSTTWSVNAKVDEAISKNGVVGLNYANGNDYENWHRLKPEWKLYGSETASSVNSRGIYKINAYKGKNFYKQLTSYDKSKVVWGAFAAEAWLEIIKRDFIAGEYVWTGFDYIGEPTLWNGTAPGAQGSWPSPKNSYFGIIDTAGLPKDSFYLYRSLWNKDSTTLHILPVWNEDLIEKSSDGKVPVVVYSNAKSVRLFLTPKNGEEREIGFKSFSNVKSNNNLYEYQIYQGSDKSGEEYENLYFTFNVPYEEGSLRAIAYSDEAGTIAINDTVGRNEVKTNKVAKKIVLKQYKEENDVYADGKSLAYFEINVVDEDGNLVPDSEADIKFDVTGEGKLVGLDNGNPIDHTSYKSNRRRVFGGKGIAIVQTSKTKGEIKLQAVSEGLESACITIESKEKENKENKENKVKSFYFSKNYYVKKGHYPILPEAVKVTYTDDTYKEEKVTWDNIKDDQLNKVGIFELKGVLESGKEIFININIIDKIASLLNYSSNTQKNVKPILPSSRPAVLENGDILKVNFPIKWEEPSDSVYENVGIVTIRGTANVLGEILNVSANIRVQEESIQLGANIANQALELRQELEGANPSDTLNAIIDGNTNMNSNLNGGINRSLWSNYNAAQTGKTKSDIIFKYATQQRLGRVKIYFAKDANALRYPDANSTKLYISEDGTNYTQIIAKEDIAKEEISTNVKLYTYDFSPKTFTFLKVEINNSTKNEGMSLKPCTGITELELNTALGSYKTYDTLDLDKLEINDVEYDKESLKSKNIYTPALYIDSIKMLGKDNCSTTFIRNRENDNKAYIIIESEDNSKRRKIVINLDSDEVLENADYAGRDYPYKNMNIEVGNYQNNEGPDNTNDGNIDTLWHTLWHKDSPLAERWILMELDKESLIDGLRYYSRNGQSNGRVGDYKIYISSDKQAWTEVKHGKWENQAGWKMADFKPINAKYVKLEGVNTYGDGNQQNKFMSASEIRVKLAKATINISDKNTNAKAYLEQDKYLKDDIKAPIKPMAKLLIDNKELKYGLDYKIKYENNERTGIAYAIVKGILKYSGEIKLAFKITSSLSRDVFVEDGTILEAGLKKSKSSFEKGEEVRVKAAEKEGLEFAYWQISPSGLSISNKNNKEISFNMPDHSVKLKAVYQKDGKREAIAYTNTFPNNWFANADEKDMKDILEDLNLNSNNVNLKLNMVKSDKNKLKATKSDAEADIDIDNEKAFYISGELLKEELVDGKFISKPITEAKTLKVTIELPKKNRNKKDYKLLSYKKDGNEVVSEFVDYSENDGFISFMLSTDRIYGIFYKKTYEIIFEDYDGTQISKQYVGIGEMPEIPQPPERKNYNFVSWDKEVKIATVNKKYKAIYEMSGEELEKIKEKLGLVVEEIRNKLIGFENAYTDSSMRKLERELLKGENLLEDCNNIIKLERQIQSIINAYNRLEKKSYSNTSSSGSSSYSAQSISANKNNYEILKGSWQRKGDKWQFYKYNKLIKNQWAYDVRGSKKIWYLFDEDGFLHTGWYKNKYNQWFYLEENDEATQGQMQLGWKWIKSKDGKMRCYYFEENGTITGSLLVDTIVDNKYTINANGAWTVNGIEQIR